MPIRMISKSVFRISVLALFCLVVWPLFSPAQAEGIHERQIEKMRAIALNENKEANIFLITTDSGAEVFSPSQDNNTETSADFEYSQLHELFASGKKIVKIVYIHTHPLEALSGESMALLSSKDIDRIRKDKKLLSPLPPSLTDIATVADMEEEFGQANASVIHHQVVDPTGIWRYRGSSGAASAFGEFRRSVREYRKTKKIYEQKGDSATEEEMNAYIDADVAREFFMLNSKEFSKVAEIQDKLFKFNGSADTKAKNALIEEYIDRAKEAGVEVSYEPFEK